MKFFKSFFKNLVYKNIILNLVLVFQFILILVLMFQMFMGVYNPILIIQSDSMEPSIFKGDLVLINARIDLDDLLLNDTIAYYNPYEKRIIVHRLIEKTEDGFYLTKGDNNLYYDFFLVDKKQILGRVVMVI
ncbi:MAG: signal peptidase I [Nanoarchaeota archaeon]|nr:signal peptidase I [Nanoarchaeota archaeon]